MSTYKFVLEKFNGLDDFTLWKGKIRAVLVQQFHATILEWEEKLPQYMDTENRIYIQARAHNTILLCLTNGVLR